MRVSYIIYYPDDEHLQAQTTANRLYPPAMGVMDVAGLPQQVRSVEPSPEELPDDG